MREAHPRRNALLVAVAMFRCSYAGIIQIRRKSHFPKPVEAARGDTGQIISGSAHAPDRPGFGGHGNEIVDVIDRMDRDIVWETRRQHAVDQFSFVGDMQSFAITVGAQAADRGEQLIGDRFGVDAADRLPP